MGLPLVISVELDKAQPKFERSFELERVVFFSDAVFAIAITLLAIELRVPNLGEIETSAALLQALLSDWAHLFAFLLSFWIIGLFWMGHHRYFRFIIRYDDGLILRNLLTLFFLTLVPFTTLVLGEYGNLPAAIWVYSLDLIGLGLSGAWLWRHATQRHRLVAPELDPQLIRIIQLRAFATPLAGVIVIFLSFFIGEYATFGFFLVIIFQRILANRYRALGY